MRFVVTMAGCSRLQGGLYHSVRRFWLGMHNRGHQVEVKAVEDVFTEEDKSVYDPIPVKIFRCIGPQRISYSPQMIEYFQAQSGQHDLISSHGLWSYADYGAGKAAEIMNIPHVIHPHGMLDSWALKNSSWKKKLSSWLFQKKYIHQATAFRALCDAEKEAIRQFGYKGPIAVIPNGVNITELEEQQDDEFKAQITSIKSDRKVMLFLSRIHPKKNLIALIKAWKKIKKYRKDWLLVIAGPDELGHGNEIKHCVEELELQNEIKLTGPLYGAQKSEWLRQADGFILPSMSEGFPIVLLEAAAMKLPCIQTPQCHFRELVQAGGSLMTTTKAKDIALSMIEFIQLSEEEREQMGANGRKLIESSYTWPDISEKADRFFDHLINGSKIPEFVESKKS